MIELHNIDCMEAMKQMPDKAFDLAIVDPPYGINVGKKKTFGMGRKTETYRATEYNVKPWDKDRPNKGYFTELFRVSERQIIWGYNYFSDMLPPCRGVIFWDKLIGDNDFSSGELAWTSEDRPLKMFKHYHGGNRVSNNIDLAKQYVRIHPTQKPVKLYEWLLTNYAKPGDKILDTHGGSFSLAIACDTMGYDFTGYEIDAEYYEGAKKRLEEHRRQGKMVFV